MRTNLIFKRQETCNGETVTVTKIIPVEIEGIERGEGWILSGHTDLIQVVCDKTSTSEVQQTILQPEASTSKTKKNDLSKFQSPVKGTAKLVRAKNVIKIVARRGKSTFNQTTPNSVCIDDCTKNMFFKHCREVFPNTGVFQFSIEDGKHYDHWNTFIDKEYIKQKQSITYN